MIETCRWGMRWDLHFLNEALLQAKMSKDPNTQVGAVIVGEDKELRSTGFNGFPRGITDTPGRLMDKPTKLNLMVHAEINAICNAARIGTPLKGTALYLSVTDRGGDVWGGAPCIRCSVELIQAGIAEIVTWPFKADMESSWRASVEQAAAILGESGVRLRIMEQVAP
jgi:dCMP deaminase